MVGYLCSRDNRVTRLERDGHSWAAHPVLDGVSAACVSAMYASGNGGPEAMAPG